MAPNIATTSSAYKTTGNIHFMAIQWHFAREQNIENRDGGRPQYERAPAGNHRLYKQSKHNIFTVDSQHTNLIKLVLG